MPELSRFYGIIIRMFVEPSERHHTAHFHAYYQDYAAVFSIGPIERVAGTIPQRQERLVEAWAELCTRKNCWRTGSSCGKGEDLRRFLLCSKVAT